MFNPVPAGGQDHIWLVLENNYKVRTDGSPGEQQLDDLSLSHESLTSARFYTTTEFKEFRTLTEESAYHDTLTYSLLYGDQVQKGLITGNPTMALDFGKLTNVPSFVDEFDLIKRVDTFVERFGDYMALVVILL